MRVDDAIRTRRTHKAYGPEPVAPAILDELFELARWAPNHHLTNPWRFRVVGPRSLERLKQADPDGARKLDRAPTLIAVSAVQTGDELADEEDLLASAVAAYIVLLAAHARGIASYWRTPRVLRTQEGRDALGMPAGERVIGLLHLGYSDREWSPPPRADAGEVVRFLE